MRPRILILDDSLSVRMELAEGFEQAGFATCACETVAAARRALDSERVDAAVLDVVLPDGDGLELLAEIRDHAERGRLPILMLSTESELGDRVSGLERGADEYFGKPFVTSQVISRVVDLLGNRASLPAAPTVLVIDDSLTFCEALRERLEERGFRVVVAATGEEGLRKATEHRLDAVIVDGVLPGIDGATVLRRLRLDPALQRVACLFLTASESGADEVAALEAGADAFVRKEHDLDFIIGRLRVLLRAAEVSRTFDPSEASKGPRRILLVSEHRGFAEWVQPIFAGEGWDVVRARSRDEALRLLCLQVPDVLVLEASPDSEAIAGFCQRLRALPVLVNTAVVVLAHPSVQAEMAAALEAGADDWIAAEQTKPGLLRARIRALLRRRDIEERERSFQEQLSARARQLELANGRLRLHQELIDRMPLGAVVADYQAADDLSTYRCIIYNPAMHQALSRAGGEVLGAALSECFPELVDPDLGAACQRAVDTGAPQRMPTRRLDGGERAWDLQVVPLVAGKIGILAEDVTERMEAEAARDRMETQMHAAQRLEAVGRLAGGVSHDFNNLLTIIKAGASFLRSSLEADDERHEDVDMILEATDRAAALTRHLLAFSRRQVQQLTTLNLNRTVAEIDRMLQRLIGEDVDLVTLLDPELGNVRADEGQIEQVIMNLAVNARDAMPDGGKLTIETRNVELDETYATGRGASVPPGSYVLIAVSDTGIGMDADTQERIFEPFFTTKERGKGTGLGLATVYGILKQSGGYIWVYSEVGSGTTFKVYLPRVWGEEEASRRPRREAGNVSGVETVLLVEDEDRVRDAVSRMLAGHGYQVIEARAPKQALALAEEHDGDIALLLTDVVMPDLSGRELADALRASRPALRVVYMSGYADSAIIHRGVLEPGAIFVHKPFSPDRLLTTIRQTLDGAA